MSSQSSIILSELETTPNEWVPMPHLASVAKCYAVNSRVSDLREVGHNIVNKVDRVDGKAISYYMLRKEAA